MSIYKREGSPYYTMEFMVKGVRYKETTGETKKRDAKEVEEQYKAKIKARYKKYGDIPVPTYWEAAHYYLTTKDKTVSAGEGRSEKGALARGASYHKRLLDFCGQNTSIDKITTPKLAQYVQMRLSPIDGVKGVKGATVKRELNDLKAVLNKAKEICPSYIPPVFPKLKDSAARIRYLSNAEEIALFKVMPEWLKNLVLFTMHTGARKKDALNLRWRDVLKNEDGEINAVNFPTPKGRKPYRVPASPSVKLLLIALSSVKEGDHTCVFRGRHGGPIVDPKRAWEKAINESGVEDFVFHDLRHTFASRLIMRGKGLKEVSELMGHADIAMTMRYAHLAPSALDDAVLVLG